MSLYSENKNILWSPLCPAQKFQDLISGYQTSEDIPGGPVHWWSQQQHKYHQHHHKQHTNKQNFPPWKMILCK